MFTIWDMRAIVFHQTTSRINHIWCIICTGWTRVSKCSKYKWITCTLQQFYTSSVFTNCHRWSRWFSWIKSTQRISSLDQVNLLTKLTLLSLQNSCDAEEGDKIFPKKPNLLCYLVTPTSIKLPTQLFILYKQNRG